MIKFKRISRVVSWACLFSAILLFGNYPNMSTIKAEEYDPKNDIFNTIGLLREGDIICRRCRGLFSKYCASYSSDRRYSHVGMVTLCDDKWSVIHAAVEDFTRPGCVMLVSLEEYLDNTAGWAVFRYNLPSKTVAQAVTIVKMYKQAAIPFDFNFDINSSEELYCTELIYTAINHAAGRDIINPGSEKYGKIIVAVEDCYSHEIASLVIMSESENEFLD